MRRAVVLLPMIVVGLALAGTASAAEGISGRYASTDGAELQLELREDADGRVSGMLSGEGFAMRLDGRREGGQVVGSGSMDGIAMTFRATLQQGVLLMELAEAGYAEDRETLVFGPAATPSTAEAAPGAAADGAGVVVVNGKALGAADLARVRELYGLGIPPGDYWYDRVLGAWGVRGSQTLGFIAPGLELGGELQADASGGGTGIFVNGRELHAYDVLALQQITGPIMPGRYFITAEGLAGPEGGPALWNLRAMAAPAAGGGSNTWQSRITGASGFSDGNTGAVFLPNGGIVSYGN
jgi:hypothetical protein